MSNISLYNSISFQAASILAHVCKTVHEPCSWVPFNTAHVRKDQAQTVAAGEGLRHARTYIKHVGEFGDHLHNVVHARHGSCMGTCACLFLQHGLHLLRYQADVQGHHVSGNCKSSQTIGRFRAAFEGIHYGCIERLQMRLDDQPVGIPHFHNLVLYW